LVTNQACTPRVARRCLLSKARDSSQC
jgi:hypothetical protein